MEKRDIDILIVEDNSTDARFVTELLKGSTDPAFRVTHAENLGEALRKISGAKPDAVFLDLNLPDSQGLDTLSSLLESDQNLPVIVLTGNDSEAVGLAAVRRNAADYLVKGKIDVSILIRSIRYSIERKKAEEVLRRDRRMLERLVEQKTQEALALQEEAEKAKRLADIGMLAATVAHELRNPLAGIRLAVYNIKRKVPDPIIENNLQNIDNKVTESDQIINNLLFYSKIKVSHLKNVNIYNILKASVEEALRGEEGKPSPVKFSIDPIKEMTFEADPLQLKEIFANILNNAIDAIDEKKGRIEIGAKIDGDFLVISIKDNGSGINKEDMERVFDPFFTTKAKGTGLGLAVCRQIVTLHGGTIQIESEPGKGTNVSISLPKK